MKSLKVLISGFLLVMLTACGSTVESEADKAKYEFNDLESTDRISNWTLDNWDVIDNKSLIVETRSNQSYLFVLSFPVQELNSALAILVSSSVGNVQARFDTVSTARAPLIKSTIENIYKLEGDEQIAEVKQQINGE